MTTIVVPVPSAGRFQYWSGAALSVEAILDQGGNIVLESFSGHRLSGTADRWVQLIPKFEQPGGGESPLISIRVPPDATFSFSVPNGWRFPTPSPQPGDPLRSPVLWWVVSTTSITYTPSTDTCWVNASGRYQTFFNVDPTP